MKVYGTYERQDKENNEPNPSQKQRTPSNAFSMTGTKHEIQHMTKIICGEDITALTTGVERQKQLCQ